MLNEIKYQKEFRNVPAGSLGFSTLILHVQCLELIESFRSGTSSSMTTTLNDAYLLSKIKLRNEKEVTICKSYYTSELTH